MDLFDRIYELDRILRRARILEARVTEAASLDIPDAHLDSHFATAYGIFAGKLRHTAVLRFSPARARWVADEIWHPEQKGHFEDGHYILEIPYADSRELVGDILRHGPEVVVVSPPALREEVLPLLEATLRSYQG